MANAYVAGGTVRGGWGTAIPVDGGDPHDDSKAGHTLGPEHDHKHCEGCGSRLRRAVEPHGRCCRGVFAPSDLHEPRRRFAPDGRDMQGLGTRTEWSLMDSEEKTIKTRLDCEGPGRSSSLVEPALDDLTPFVPGVREVLGRHGLGADDRRLPATCSPSVAAG